MEQHNVQNDKTSPIIEELKKFSAIGYEEYKKEGAEFDQNVVYQELTDLCIIKHPDHTNTFIYYDRNNKFRLFYTSNSPLLEELDISSLKSIYGEPLAILGSRAAKHGNHYVYSGNGFAFSEIDDNIVFLEIFSPMSLEEYKEAIYIEPLYRK